MQRIGFIVLPGFQMMSVATLSVFELANWEYWRSGLRRASAVGNRRVNP